MECRWNRVVSYRAVATGRSLSANQCQKEGIDLRQHPRRPRSTVQKLFSRSRSRNSLYISLVHGEMSQWDRCRWARRCSGGSGEKWIDDWRWGICWICLSEGDTNLSIVQVFVSSGNKSFRFSHFGQNLFFVGDEGREIRVNLIMDFVIINQSLCNNHWIKRAVAFV